MHPNAYPSELAIQPLTAAPDLTVSVPGSKSLTNRALVLAALGMRGVRGLQDNRSESTTLTGALQSEDTEVMLSALSQLGFLLEIHWDEPLPRIVFPPQKNRGQFPESANLFVANSGTTIRFLAAMLTTGRGRYRLDGIPRMRERPIQDLLDALNQFEGVNAYSEAGTGCPPAIIESRGLTGGHVTVKAGISSQYLSAILLAAPYSERGVTVEIVGPVVSEPYIAMTVEMTRQWGLSIERTGNVFRVEPCSHANPTTFAIEPDASSASYFFAAAAITGGRITVRGMSRSMLQGDVQFVELLEKMGCIISQDGEGVTVRGGKLKGIDVDMNAISDTVMTLAAVACYAEGPTTIRNVAHIRHKETDRIAAVATELKKLGMDVGEFEDGLTITPRPVTPAAVDTYNDHRMAMSLALVGLNSPGVIVKNPGCVVKTYPGFWRDFEKLRG